MTGSDSTPELDAFGDGPANVDESKATVSWVEQGLDAIRNTERRYALFEVIGQGSFGKVYRALDQKVGREVAYKASYVKDSNSETEDEDLRALLRQKFQEEARRLARLEHENIAPIFDAGETTEGGYYIVSKLIRGENLSKWQARVNPSVSEILRVVQVIGSALVYVHSKGLLHGDIKPANIMMEDTGKPYLIDFGLSIHDSEIVFGFGTQGSPAYMSPEQARHEPLWQTNQSDIYSLGVVLFELLVGRRPFIATHPHSLLKQIGENEAPSIRQFRPDLTIGIEQVCARALARLSSQRYKVAQDFVKDLADCRAEIEQKSSIAIPLPATESRIVPKGLRAFDTQDSDFYLRLLPGPKNRLGVPDSITFWQSFVAVDSSTRQPVGILHGPSGCGKTSLLRAGILPRLDHAINVIYVDAMSEDFEASIEAEVRKQFEWPSDRSLHEELPKLRTQRNASRKQLIVIDQLEQYLHRTKELRESTLVQTLRLLDGRRFQAILSVRSDYWNQLCRLLAEIQTKVSEENCRHIDLFEQSHARDVLMYFGQAYGKLPERESWKDSDSEFLNQAIAELSIGNRVVPVRLAMFTQILQSATWNIDSLAKAGGVDGLYLRYLDLLFLDKYSDIRYQSVADPAQKFLAELLPSSGIEIRGHARAVEDLRNAIGYSNRDAEFKDLVRILDRELRVITPVFSNKDHAANEPVEESAELAGRRYQLTHDFLVPSIRAWIDQGMSKTPAGRAFRQLRSLSEAYSTSPETRNLPTFLEWLGCWFFAKKFAWNEKQLQLMSRANKYYFSRVCLSILLVAIAAIATYTYNSRASALALVEKLRTANVESVLPLVSQASASRFWTEGKLEALADKEVTSPTETREQLHARLALCTSTDRYNSELVQALLNESDIRYTEVLCRQLQLARVDAVKDLKVFFLNNQNLTYQRINAVLYLTSYDSPDSVLTKDDFDQLATLIVRANLVDIMAVKRLLGRYVEQLAVSLNNTLVNDRFGELDRISALNLLIGLGFDRSLDLRAILAKSTPNIHLALITWLEKNDPDSKFRFLNSLSVNRSQESSIQVILSERELAGRTNAYVAMLLTKFGRVQETLEVFEFKDDPEQVYQFIYGCRERGVTLAELLQLFDSLSLESKDPNEWDRIYGVVLSMGDFAPEELSDESKGKLIERLANLYENHPSSGVHGATGWLLRIWDKKELVERTDNKEFRYSPDRQWFTIKAERSNQRPFFFTFVVIPAGVYFVSRSPDEDDNKLTSASTQQDRGMMTGSDKIAENLRSVRLSSPVAILDREMTFEDLSWPRLYGVVEAVNAKKIARSGLIPITDLESVMKLAAGGTNWQKAKLATNKLTKVCNIDRKELAYSEASGATSSDKEFNFSCRGFRLPTIAEWEIANRCGCTTRFSTGNDPAIMQRHAWTFENSSGSLHEPKEKRPNRWGVFDLEGNVREWCQDLLPEDSLKLDNRDVDPVGVYGIYNSLKGGAVDRILGYSACSALSQELVDSVNVNAYSGVRPVIRLPLPSPLAVESEKDNTQQP